MLRSNAGLILLLLCNASTAALQGTCDLPTKQGFSQQDSQQAKPHRSRQPELRDGGALRAAALELRGLLKDARTASAALSSAALELHGLLQAADAAALALDTAAARQDSALQAASGHTTGSSCGSAPRGCRLAAVWCRCGTLAQRLQCSEGEAPAIPGTLISCKPHNISVSGCDWHARRSVLH
jgi:hypothetical protein